MNHFERIAIFTAVENIETQLRGLKTMIAASADQGLPPQSHKVTQGMPVDSHELSEADEDRLHKTLEDARKQQIAKMASDAGTHFEDEWENLTQGMSKLDG